MESLVWSPVRFFEARRSGRLDWVTVFTAPVVCAALQGVSVAIFHAKTRPVMDTVLARLDLSLTGLPMGAVFATTSLLTYPMFFGILTLAVLAVDVLVTGSRQPVLLTKFTALGFYTQVPYCLLMIVIAWLWEPEPLRLPTGSSTAELLNHVRRYQATMLSGPLLSTGQLLSYYSLIWLAVVLAVALKVVGELSVRATVLIAIVLFCICAAGPILGSAAGALR